VPKFIELMSDGKRPVIFGDGEQTRDFVYIEDVVRANVAAVESDESGVYNVGRGERVSVIGLVEQMNNVLGLEYEPIYADPRPGDIQHSGADVSKAREDFGFEAKVGLKKGLTEIVGCFDHF